MTESEILVAFDEVILQVRRGKIDDVGKVAIRRLLAEMGYEMRCCRYESCGMPFIPKNAINAYCKNEHKNDDWNKNRRAV
jgi:hypothetical protein